MTNETSITDRPWIDTYAESMQRQYEEGPPAFVWKECMMIAAEVLTVKSMVLLARLYQEAVNEPHRAVVGDGDLADKNLMEEVRKFLEQA
jgi:hypothetical protein